MNAHELITRVAKDHKTLVELIENHNRVVRFIKNLESRFIEMAANQSQVLQALTGLKASLDTLKSQVQNVLQNGGGAPDEQPVIDQISSIQSEVTGLIALMPSASTPVATGTNTGTGQANTSGGASTANVNSAGADTVTGGSGSDSVTGSGGTDKTT